MAQSHVMFKLIKHDMAVQVWFYSSKIKTPKLRNSIIVIKDFLFFFFSPQHCLEDKTVYLKLCLPWELNINMYPLKDLDSCSSSSNPMLLRSTRSWKQTLSYLMKHTELSMCPCVAF